MIIYKHYCSPPNYTLIFHRIGPFYNLVISFIDAHVISEVTICTLEVGLPRCHRQQQPIFHVFLKGLEDFRKERSNEQGRNARCIVKQMRKEYRAMQTNPVRVVAVRQSVMT